MTRLAITGMSCGHCKAAVEKALAGVEGVTRVEVDLAGGQALVEGSAPAELLVAAVVEEGYQANPMQA